MGLRNRILRYGMLRASSILSRESALLGNRRADRYQDVFGNVLLDLARKDKRVVGITPAMATYCGMNLLADELPGQFFDVGIEEEHAVTFSAGLAA